VRSALYVIPCVQLAGFTTLTLSFVLGFLVDGTLLRVLNSWVFPQRLPGAGVQEQLSASLRLVPSSESVGERLKEFRTPTSEFDVEFLDGLGVERESVALLLSE
ncbi:hypothetical protein, partial [Escherichia coli]|uniref:hypothetical protein n=1 Tax=Escherichia coli TaxID=562 RepID=UPI001F491DE6